MNANRLQTFVAIIIPLLNSGFLSAALFFEGYFFHFTILSLFTADVLLYLYVPPNTPLKIIFKLAAIPFLYFIATAGALFFSNSTPLSAFLIATFLFLNLAYFLSLRGFFLNDDAVKAFPVPIFFVHCYAIFFSLSILFFSLIYFLDIPFWYLIFPFTFIVCGTQDVALANIKIEKHIRILIAACTALAVSELFYALSWLPLEFAPSAGLGTLLYILYFDIVARSVSQNYEKKRLAFFSAIIFFMIILITVLSKWR